MTASDEGGSPSGADPANDPLFEFVVPPSATDGERRAIAFALTRGYLDYEALTEAVEVAGPTPGALLDLLCATRLAPHAEQIRTIERYGASPTAPPTPASGAARSEPKLRKPPSERTGKPASEGRLRKPPSERTGKPASEGRIRKPPSERTGKPASEGRLRKPPSERTGKPASAGRIRKPPSERTGKPASEGRLRKSPSEGRRRVSDRAAPKGPQLPVWAIPTVLGAGALVLIAVFVALSGSGSPEPAVTAEAEARQDTGPSDATPVEPEPERPQPEPAQPEPAKPEVDFSDGPPRLPADVAEALALIDAYGEARPKDDRGRLALLEQLYDRAPAGPLRDRVSQRLEPLREQVDRAASVRLSLVTHRAKELASEGAYDQAIALWRNALPDLPARLRPQVEAEVQRLVRVGQAAAALARAAPAGAAVPDPAGLTPAERRAELARLGAALAAAEGARGSAAFERVAARATALRQAERAARRAEGAAALARAREQLATHDEARTDALVERTRLAADRSDKYPVPFANGARILRLGEDDFTLSSHGGRAESTFRYGQRPALTVEVLSRACRRKSVEDQEQLLELALRYRLFDAADKAASRLKRWSPDRRVPDVAGLRRASRPLRADPLPKGEDGGLYDFRRDDAAEMLPDWSTFAGDGSTMRTVPGEGLEISGPNAPGAYLRSLGFAGAVTFEVDWPRSRADGAVIVRLDAQGEGGTRIAAYLNQEGGAKLLFAAPGDGLDDASDWLRGSRGPVRLTVSAGRATLEFGGSEASCRVPPFSTVSLSLETIGDGHISVTWPRVRVAGKLRSAWRRKALAAYGPLLQRELERERWEARTAAEPSPDERLVIGTGLPSVDDAWAQATLPGAVRAAYTQAWKLLREGDLNAAVAGFGRALGANPHHAGALYGRGVARLLGGAEAKAKADLDAALAQEPEFPEALVARAQLAWVWDDLWTADADLGRAVALAPGLGDAHHWRGKVALGLQDWPRAREAFGLAATLDPSNAMARRYRSSLTQVAAGPPWERRFEHESTHFRVATDISPERAERMAETLELARASYERLLGKPSANTRPSRGKASCLVFDTAEGYFNYATFMSLDRHDERTVGYYSPLYGQLVFFEDRDDTAGEDLTETAVHEGFHRYADETLGRLPMWLSEGLAELFGGEAIRKDGILTGRLSELQSALAEGRTPPVAELLFMDRSAFYGPTATVNYAMAWSLCRFFARGGAAARPYRPAFDDFLRRLRAGEPPPTAAQEAFGGVDAARLERAWRGYVSTLR